MFIRFHIILISLGLIILMDLSGHNALAAQQKQTTIVSLTPGFMVKSPDIAVSDVNIGQYRRVIRPFPNWTLICDENLAKRQKICNISQTIIGPEGGNVFSWSLAATEAGRPFFILRTPSSTITNTPIYLDLNDGAPPLSISVKGCDTKICIAYEPVIPRLRSAVKKGAIVQVSFATNTPSNVTRFRAPLQGLVAALAAL